MTEPPTGLPTPPDSECAVEEDAYTDWEVDEVDEEAMKKFLSARYVRGSKPPMKLRLTAPWGLPLSDADVEKITAGFQSRDMDDRWDLLIEDPDEDGGISVHIFRSWLQEECYILHIVPKPGDDEGGSAVIQSITWEGNKEGLQCDAEQAEKEAVMVARSHLDCEFETLPDYPPEVMWDSSAYELIRGRVKL